MPGQGTTGKVFSLIINRCNYRFGEKWTGEDCEAPSFTNIKDGAYYCYCAYILRISTYSDFLSPMLTNTGIFLRGLKLSGESRS